MNNNDKLKVGIIGFGYMGKFHLNRIKEIHGINVIAVFDIDNNRLNEAIYENVKTYDNINDFLNNIYIDLVVICTPNNSHKEYALMSLEKGKHVLCEKPATLFVSEIEEVLNSAVKNNRIFTVHQNRRWDVDYKLVKEVVDNELIGKITKIESKIFGQRGICFDWRADPKSGGGMLYDWEYI